MCLPNVLNDSADRSHVGRSDLLSPVHEAVEGLGCEG
jgi:hypothetical protein